METARRRYFAHTAHPSVGISAFPEIRWRCGQGIGPANRPNDSALQVLFVVPPLDEPLEEAIWTLKEHLEQEGSCECHRAFCGLADLPAEDRQHADCVLLLCADADEGRWRESVEVSCQHGQGIVAVAIRGDATSQRVVARVVPGAEHHPVVQSGPTSIAVSDGPPIAEPPQDAQILFASDHGPVAWSVRLAAGGMFFMWVGDAAGLTRPSVRRLLRNALGWTADR